MIACAPPLCNGFMTTLRVVSIVTTDARDDLFIADLAEQTRQHWRVPGRIVGYLDSTNFQRGRVNAKIDPAPLSTIVGAIAF